MDLSIVIVSWNVKPLLQRCLQSIHHFTQGLNFEVFVIDNASHDGSADMVATEFPQVHLIRNAYNKGFGAANNQALLEATGRYILFLNDDTEIDANIFRTLVEKYDQLNSAPKKNKIGMIGCRLLNADGTQQESVRAFPTVFDQTIILLKLHHVLPWLVSGYRQTYFDYNTEQTVDQIMGAFMLVPRKLLDKYGSFDEEFFNWFEEVDLQKRLHDAGFSIVYTPVVKCLHIKGASFGQLRRPKAQAIFNRSMRWYFKKHHSLFGYLWIACIQPISLTLAYVVQIFR